MREENSRDLGAISRLERDPCEVTRYFVPLLFSTGAPINFLQPIKLFKKANCNILIPLISSYILIYGVNGVRLICRKQ